MSMSWRRAVRGFERVRASPPRLTLAKRSWETSVAGQMRHEVLIARPAHDDDDDVYTTVAALRSREQAQMV